MSTSIKTDRTPLLFTPGPLTTSLSTKQAMAHDYGSRDPAFVALVQHVRDSLLRVAGVTTQDGWESVIMQGSGTFCVESVLTTVLPRHGAKLLIIANGAYGRRMATMAEVLDIPHTLVNFSERTSVPCEAVLEALRSDSSLTHLAIVHHETTCGVLNPMEEIGRAAKQLRPDLVYIVDSMSAFGCYPVNLKDSPIDYIVSSANKCIEGVPGFAFALCRRSHFETTANNSRSLSLDLHAQWTGLEKNGQFRFTPPTHALLAFNAALGELETEGGPEKRRERYEENAKVLLKGMAELGFESFVPESSRGCIISTFLYPQSDTFDFGAFARGMFAHGIAIYPGKLTNAECFRLGHIGRMFASDMRTAVLMVRETLVEMGLAVPVCQQTV